jgi:aldehyde:ferredoxin oxidoreductase
MKGKNINPAIKGASGNVLRVNLTTGRMTTEAMDRHLASQYLAGTGYASKILWDELAGGLSPFSPDNKLLLTTGLLTGTGVPGSDSIFSVFKSPLTHCIGESRSGGGMGIELKRAGFDVVIVEGASRDPVYLWIHHGKAEIKAAKHVWGKTVPDTQKILKDELAEPKARVICIGPAGEKLVRYSSMMVEQLRAMGRCGGGAVMGSKNLKAIVIRGEQQVPVASPETLKELIKETMALEINHPLSGVKPQRDRNLLSFANGTASFLSYYDKIGEIPTKNGLSNTWGKGKAIFQDLQGHITGDEGCLNCVLRCGKRSEVKEGKWKTPEGEGPEYETIAGFAHYLMNDNVEAIIHINHLCNNYGIDTISCANAIAFAMECYEKGVISKEDTDGVELTWGNMDAVKEMLTKIVYRDGFGDVLAEGVFRAAEKLGNGSDEFALHVKGLELPAHDTRSKGYGKAWAIQYATANRGMCHSHPQEPGIVHGIFDDRVIGMRDLSATLKEPYSEIGKGKMVKWSQDFGNVMNMLGFCSFHSYLIPGAEFKRYSDTILAATGLEITFEGLMEIGERLSNLQRCFNVREGTRRKDDMIPKRLLQVPAFGPYSDRPELEIKSYDAMLDEYYEARGWDKSTGIPKKEKLEELGIEWPNMPQS